MSERTFGLTNDRGQTYLHTICKGGVKINQSDVNTVLTFTSKDAAMAYIKYNNLVAYIAKEL